MTDTNPSGASFAPAADTSAPAASTETPAGIFGSTRGSGLARGKRQSSAAAPTANTAKSDYKPSALEVITPASEYKNPFASHEPATPPAEQPAIAEIPPAPVAAEVEPEPQAAAPEVPMFAPEPEPVKREIHILPPAESARPAVSWESPSMSARSSAADDLPRHDERPMFRPDRREDAAGAQPAVREPQGESFNREPRQHRDPREQRQPRDPRELRQPRDPRDARQPRDPREARQPRDPREARQPRDPRDEEPQFEQRPKHNAGEPAVEPARGFFAWLKSLFSGPKPVSAPVVRESGGDGFEGGQRHRRRHRGGRGHGGSSQGHRGDRSSFQGGPRQEGQPGGEGEHRSGERQGGPRRRRHRGGPGRDRGGEPRSEGRQGGGAI